MKVLLDLLGFKNWIRFYMDYDQSYHGGRDRDMKNKGSRSRDYGGSSRSSHGSSNYEALKELFEKQNSLRVNIRALKAEISQKNEILRTMTGVGMEHAYESLDAEIAGLVREKNAEVQELAETTAEIERLKKK